MEIDNRWLFMSSSPHMRAEENTRSIMTDIIIALFFPLIMAVYFFGWRPAVLVAISVVSSVMFEWIYCCITKRKSTIGDMSAIATGILLVMCLPPSVPLWFPVIGAFFAIVLAKMLFGGNGKYFLNPVLTSRALLLSWPAFMSVWTKPNLGANALGVFADTSREALSPDVIASVTPLLKMKQGILPSAELGSGSIVSSIRDVAIGNVAGCIGEVSALVIIAAAIYLIVRKVITAHIPVAYVGTVAILTFLFPRGGNPAWEWMVYSVCSGGLLFGAVFLATDFTTTPVTAKGRIVFGVGCGLITVLLRYFGMYNEGVTCAILVMNLCACFIDRIIKPRRYGMRLKKKKAGELDE